MKLGKTRISKDDHKKGGKQTEMVFSFLAICVSFNSRLLYFHYLNLNCTLDQWFSTSFASGDFTLASIGKTIES